MSQANSDVQVIPLKRNCIKLSAMNFFLSQKLITRSRESPDPKVGTSDCHIVNLVRIADKFRMQDKSTGFSTN